MNCVELSGEYLLHYSSKIELVGLRKTVRRIITAVMYYRYKVTLAATLRWFTAGGAIRIAVRQLSQTWKLRHYDVITRKL